MRLHTALVACLLQSIIDERKIRFQRPETWVLQLHLKDGRRFNPKQGNETCLRLALTAACLRLRFHSGLLAASFYLLVSRPVVLHIFVSFRVFHRLVISDVSTCSQSQLFFATAIDEPAESSEKAAFLTARSALHQLGSLGAIFKFLSDAGRLSFPSFLFFVFCTDSLLAGYFLIQYSNALANLTHRSAMRACV